MFFTEQWMGKKKKIKRKKDCFKKRISNTPRKALTEFPAKVTVRNNTILKILFSNEMTRSSIHPL